MAAVDLLSDSGPVVAGSVLPDGAGAAGPDGLAALGVLASTVAQTRRMIAAMESMEMIQLAAAAALAEDTAAESGLGVEMAYREVATELAVTMRVSDRTVQRHLSDAVMIVNGFPITFAAFSQGRISKAHLTVIVDAGVPIPPGEAREQFEHAAVAQAVETTPARLRAMVEVLAEDANPRSLAERHEEARAGRCVTVRPICDGMSELNAILPTVLARGIHDRLTRQAHALQDATRAAERDHRTQRGGSGAAFGTDTTDPGAESGAAGGSALAEPEPTDDRTMDQLRADLFADMLLTGCPHEDQVPLADRTALGAIRAIIHVTVPATTTHGVGDTPATLSGGGMIDADTARTLAGHATGWDRTHTHPNTGAVLAVDRYRPSKKLTRFLRARDQHCRFPGCRIPTTRCDIDHTLDAATGGPTRTDNLAHLCRRHHTLKHATRWQVTQHPGGILEWTSPTGATYIDTPPTSVTFHPQTDHPPGSQPESPPCKARPPEPPPGNTTPDPPPF